MNPVGQPDYLIWSTGTYKGIARHRVTVIADKPSIQASDPVAHAWGETAMTRRCLMIAVSLLAASCDRSDYVIDLKRAHIERVDRNGGIGYIVVDKASADTMARYGDVYVQGRTCPEVSCKTMSVGSLLKHDQVPVEGGVRLPIATIAGTEADKDYPPFWLRNVACLRLEAVQGFMGRTGRSDWNCSVTFRTD